MRVAVFSTKPYDREFLTAANAAVGQHELVFFPGRLEEKSTPLALGFHAVSAFVNDRLDEEVLRLLQKGGTRLIALRSSGFNNVDLPAADRFGLTVVRVPTYSPHAVAEHAIALILATNRRIYRAYNRVREGNFAIEGLLGFDLYGKTAGVIGTGKIGAIVAGILRAFGCEALAFDMYPNPECKAAGVRYMPFEEILAVADIITLHCPLTPQTYHLINREAIARMKPGVMLINTSRGGLVDTSSVIEGLKSGKIGYLGLDVYEEEADLFFKDLSHTVIQDDVFMRLLTFPNVLITAHQAFFTHEALKNIAETTINNISAFEKGDPQNVLQAKLVAAQL